MKKFILQHWRGDFSLPVSYWGISFLLVALVTVLLQYITVEFEEFGTSLTFVAWMTYVYTLFAIALIVWSYVGTWRSSTKYLNSDKPGFWAYLARFAIVMGVINISGSFVGQTYPTLKLFSTFLLGGDSYGKLNLTMLDDNKTIRLDGFLGNGSYNKIKNKFNEFPKVNRIYLNSNGGRLKEVEQIAQFIQQRRVDTYVEDKCLSFCTVVFLSGYHRHSTPNAVIGFHAPTIDSSLSVTDDMLNQSRDLYRSFGLSEKFINKIFATPNSQMWYPTLDELIEYGVVNRTTFGGESNFIASLLASRSPAGAAEVFRKEKIWAAYEQKFPGFIDGVITIIYPLVQQNKSDTEILNALRKYSSSYQSKVIANSTPELRAKFVYLALRQSQEAANIGPTACYKLLNSTLDITKSLPKELASEEILITQEALVSNFVMPSNYSEKAYQKIMQKVFSNFTEAEFDAVSKPNSNRIDANVCNGLVKFYQNVYKLSLAERDIAAYGMFK